MKRLVNSQNITYIAIEGGVCCGKTTVVENLKKLYGFKVLPEYIEMLPDNHEARKRILPPKERLQLFLSLEQSRTHSIQNDPTPVFGDRCVFSVIAFEFALSKMGFPTVLPTIAKDLNYQIFFPNLTVFFDIDTDLRNIRWKQRGLDPNSIYVNTDFNKAIKQFFQMLSQFTKVLIIDAAKLNPYEMAQQVLLAADFVNQQDTNFDKITSIKNIVSKINFIHSQRVVDNDFSDIVY